MPGVLPRVRRGFLKGEKALSSPPTTKGGDGCQAERFALSLQRSPERKTRKFLLRLFSLASALRISPGDGVNWSEVMLSRVQLKQTSSLKSVRIGTGNKYVHGKCDNLVSEGSTAVVKVIQVSTQSLNFNSLK